MYLRCFLFFLSLCLITSLLLGCSNERNGDEEGIIYKNIPIVITKGDRTQKNYKLDIISDGLQKKNIAMYPIATTLIAKNGKSEFEVALGATYKVKVYATNVESIEELYKEQKKEPNSPTENIENAPLLVYEFIANEDMNKIELNITD